MPLLLQLLSPGTLSSSFFPISFICLCSLYQWMRTSPMCFSILQAPRCGFLALTSLWQEGFRSSNRTSRRFTLIGSKHNALTEGGYSRRWIRSKPIEENRKPVETTTRLDAEEALSSSATLSVNKAEELGEFIPFGPCDIRLQLAQSKDLAKLLTVIVFDLETTGFSRTTERIIEIAFQDLGGGENSTFETLVNPERFVSNSYIHGITNDMVTKPGVPRMRELIPILLQFVESRRKPDGYVLMVAHNGRTFDVPFLKSEFERCNVDFPSSWRFCCTLALARQALKLEDSKTSTKVSLEALKQRYKIISEGNAHRAMSDVKALSLILQRLTFELKIPLSGLVESSFTASELGKSVSKKEKPSSKQKNSK
ncbi:Exonuclease DPD1, chloroplastic/mitochondrial [Linum perenne]